MSATTLANRAATLASQWLRAKQFEQQAINTRIEIEEELAKALGVKTEGSQTHNLDGYKVTLTQPIYRKVDEEAWRTVAKHCPTDLQPVKYKLEVDNTAVKQLLKYKPEIWRKIASAFTSTPGKVGVKVEKVEE